LIKGEKKRKGKHTVVAATVKLIQERITSSSKKKGKEGGRSVWLFTARGGFWEKKESWVGCGKGESPASRRKGGGEESLLVAEERERFS